ncbi:MAG: 3-oxoacyl-[acyl-carrier-protein] synthase, KASIII, partial [uncultured Friedmanniella sp.]
ESAERLDRGAVRQGDGDRWLPPPPGGRQRRDRHLHRLLRRVDPHPLRDHRAPLGQRGRDRLDDEPGREPQGAGARRGRGRPDRHRHRRHRQPPAPDPGHRHHHRQRARGQERRRVRRLGRLRRVLLRADDGGLLRPDRRLEVRAGDRGGAAHRHHRQARPLDRVHLRRRRGRGRGRTERDPGHRPGRLGLRRRAGPPDRPDRAVGRRHGRSGARGRSAAVAGDADERQPGLQVGLLHDGQDRGRGHGRGRGEARGPGGLRPAPGQHADHRRHAQGPQAARHRRRRPRRRHPGQHLRRLHPVGHRDAARVGRSLQRPDLPGHRLRCRAGLRGPGHPAPL